MNHSQVNWDSIDEVSRYITRWADSNFPRRTARNALSKLVLEEIPEVLTEANQKEIDKHKLEREFADMFILLFDLGKLWELDISRGLKEKMLINEHRMWAIDGDGIAHHVSAEHPPVDFSFGGNK
jgi:NTP pyrophosphatase (non-canonical NTP hydrolase)